jgi:hypothetical protein
MDEKLEKKRFNKLQSVEKQRRLRLDDFVKVMMTTHQGREYMYWLLELTRVGQQPFTGNALTTMFNCGELNIGQQITAHVMEVAPDDYLKMLREKQEEQMNAERSDDSNTELD